MYLNNSIFVLEKMLPGLVWRRKTQKKIFLTFDDGPIPGVTEYVLEQLNLFNIKATFFCVGENIHKHADIFKKIVEAENKVGNHTYNHYNGWKVSFENYMSNVKKCDEVIRYYLEGSQTQYHSSTSHRKLFRPPYGKITPKIVRNLKTEYEVIMWSVLTGDYDREQTPEDCLRQSIRYTKDGSIVIFHDSVKAEKNLRYVLPKFIQYFTDKGYSFDVL
ncbi:MAG: polysaccharide deacetylase family protein [Cytophagaceae bacterium]|nr:polysaccharide deacetylase family protein [Cytophagaceae bacterium]MDW8455812.1 polysaccharide deacetylase family protein [Cytophagaceae bacterium]